MRKSKKTRGMGDMLNYCLLLLIFLYLVGNLIFKANDGTNYFEGMRLTWFVSIITIGVCLASLYRNTHWFSDLLGGLFFGSALLVLIIAIDRSIESDRQPS